MATVKSGIDWFPLDVALDKKFELIEAEFGLTGFGVIVHLLQEIYGKEGYYIEWTEEVALLFARKCGLGGSVVSEIIEASIRRGMFDKEIYDKYRCLTSRGIQKRYFEAVSRRKVLEVDYNILLVECAQICPNVNISSKNVNILSKNADIERQSRVEKSREEKSRVEENLGLINQPLSPCGERPSSGGAEGKPKSVRQVVMDAWNQLGVNRINRIAEGTQRHVQLKRRVKDYGLDNVLKAIENVKASDFLMGRTKEGFNVTFDWFIKPNNFPKVLDGNYTRSKDSGKASGGLTDDDLALMAAMEGH